MNYLKIGNILAADFNLYVWDSLPKEIIIALLGLGTVFAALIVIFGVIAILKFLIKFTVSGSQNTSISTGAVNSSEGQSYIGEDLSTNPELVAVITAAIMASMGEDKPADGFVVKSIRKKRNTGWN
jgi:hypothetical protein